MTLGARLLGPRLFIYYNKAHGETAVVIIESTEGKERLRAESVTLEGIKRAHMTDLNYVPDLKADWNPSCVLEVEIEGKPGDEYEDCTCSSCSDIDKVDHEELIRRFNIIHRVFGK